MRAEPSDKSEMTSQLIFGEALMILQQKEKWLLVKNDFDGYEGWISEKQVLEITPEEFMFTKGEPLTICEDLSATVHSGDSAYPITLGSLLPFYVDHTFVLGHQRFKTKAAIIEAPSFEPNPKNIITIASKYINAPYLWGGRSPFGIDCSGFTQMVFRFFNIRLYRDAYQQAEQGRTIEYIDQAQIGDLAFFENEQKRISHVGIILPERKIIHASGCVRIDTIDHNGIFRKDISAYSHKLRLIRRVL